MLQALLKALSFVFIMGLGYGLKKARLFGPQDYTVVVKMVINLTLPASVIVSFSSTEFEPSLMVLTLLGFAINCALLLTGLLITRRRPLPERALYAITLPGYNIGAFAMPFTQGFLGAQGAAITCLFDTGNAIMCTGGSYAVADSLLRPNSGEKGGLRAVGKKLLGSAPFVTYVSMLLLTLAHIQLPASVVSFFTPIANANPYCAMMMIGMMFEFRFPKETFRAVGRIVVLRNLTALCLALVIWFLLPLSRLIRGTLAALVFAPPSVLTPAFVEKCGGDPSAASCATSLCTITAIIGITTVLLLQA